MVLLRNLPSVVSLFSFCPVYLFVFVSNSLKNLKIILAISFAFTAFFIGKELRSMPLWGYWSFYFLLSVWAFVVTCWSFFISPLSNSDKLLGYSVLGGFLLFLGFPPMASSPLLFVALLPLLYIEQYIALSYDRAVRWQVFKFSFVGIFTWNLLTTWWVANSSMTAGIVALIANSLLLCIPWVLFHDTKHRLGQVWGYTSLVFYWLAFEYVHLRWDFSWTWLNLGNGFASTPALIQWYDVTGYSGGSLWILVVNILAFSFCLHRKELSMRIHWVDFKRVWIPLVIIFIPIVISYLEGSYVDSLEKAAVKTQKTAEVVAIQPNYEPHYQKFSIPDLEQLPHFLALTKQKITKNTDYVVYPETSFDNIEQHKFDNYPIIQQLHAFADSTPHLKMVMGLGSYYLYELNEPRAATAHHDENSGIDYEALNSAEQITAHQKDVPHYVKAKLVPGIEQLPYFNYLGFLAPLTESFGGTAGSLAIGKPDVFWNETHTVAVAPLICYESIFGEYVTNHIKKGANLLFIVTNDGWWDNTPGYRQHLQFASLRAIETRRYIARSANTGSSAFIDPCGRILQATAYNKTDAIRANLPIRTGETWYVRYGDVLARIAVLGSILLLSWSFIKKYIVK